LILADPSLHDPNFSRSVILLTDHSNETGAHGYILNRPLGKTVGDVLPSEEFPGIESVPIFFGGPVDQEQLTFASLEWDSDLSEIAVQTHLSTAVAGERLASGAVVRAFVGYSGWGGGQLETELQQRAWITGKSSQLVLRKSNADRLWAEILRTMGPYYTLLAGTPNDPSLN
jgi:putative transcriptional regulator